MSDLPVVIVGSFLIAFKAVLLEGSEVAILSIATVTQLGRKNVLTGVLIGTLTEGFEASLVLAAAGAFNLEWTVIGGLVNIVLLVSVSAVSYQYLLRVPRWLLDLIAGVVLLSFGLFFLVSGISSR